MTIYHVQNSPQRNAWPTHRPVGGLFTRVSTTVMRWAAVDAGWGVGTRGRERYVEVFDGGGNRAMLEVPDGDIDLDVTGTGAGGLSEARGTDRLYSGRVVATRDGLTTALWAARYGAPTNIPAGYVWRSDICFPVILNGVGAGELYQVADVGDGWFQYSAGGLVALNNGVNTGAPAVLDLTNIGGAEFIDAAVTNIRCRLYAENTSGANAREATVYEYTSGSWETLWLSGELAAMAGYGRHMPGDVIVPVQDETTSLAYTWSGAPTGGLDIGILALRY
jgi:hypothetical protein